MVNALEAARLFLLTVFSVKAGELATGKQLLPSNPFDIVQWSAVLTNYDPTTVAIIAGVLVYLLMLLIVIKKKRNVYEKVVYIPPPQYPPRK
ncbi:TPA: hypothetical protein EYP13_03045 [Candidatus Micrarchaeota archaeon]|nr:hypothetical protein [Candidatus Micrarchaeota archaeon]